MSSIFLSPDAGQAGPIDVRGDSWEHLAVHSQVLNLFEFSSLGPHGFGGVAFAHACGLISALRVVNSASAVVAASPTMLDGGIIAMSL